MNQYVSESSVLIVIIYLRTFENFLSTVSYLYDGKPYPRWRHSFLKSGFSSSGRVKPLARPRSRVSLQKRRLWPLLTLILDYLSKSHAKQEHISNLTVFGQKDRKIVNCTVSHFQNVQFLNHLDRPFAGLNSRLLVYQPRSTPRS